MSRCGRAARRKEGRPWGGRHSGRLAGCLAGCASLLSSPQLPMKACLTLLSHLGRLHEPPVPKPRGTPKLSERYAGPERLSGGLVVGMGVPLGPLWGVRGFLRAPGPPHTLLGMGRAHLWVGQVCCAPFPEAPLGASPVGGSG